MKGISDTEFYFRMFLSQSLTCLHASPDILAQSDIVDVGDMTQLSVASIPK